ncbi:hypothetical protein V2J09_007818 [Rumex salicifolius]
MSLRSNPSTEDLWSQIFAEDFAGDQNRVTKPDIQPQIAVKYQRRKPSALPVNGSTNISSQSLDSTSNSNNETRLSFVVPNTKRVSWNRSLSTRGRLSIASTYYVAEQPQEHAQRRKLRPGIPKPKAKVLEPPNFEKERAYFQEVDAFELLEESPSPKKFSWVIDNQFDNEALPTICTRLERWLHAKRESYLPSSSLSTILETPAHRFDPIPYKGSCTSTGKLSLPRRNASLGSVLSVQPHSGKASLELTSVAEADLGGVESSIQKLSLSHPSEPLEDYQKDPFLQLLMECGQSSPLSFSEVDCQNIVKIGEGTYGEAFIAGDNVCKIVPIDGDFRVNGELQKRSDELLEEVLLSLTLNRLRGNEAQIHNATTTFIETKVLRVCQGRYDPSLIKAWEDWDAKNGSENDHPDQFPEHQRYVVFVLEHGGTDLESFVLSDYEEAKSLLAQVTASLAVAEAAFQFEHRDLHWGNILLSRKETPELQFTLEGKQFSIKTSGLSVSVIDFTLSRLNTGNIILYLDLSSDPELFEGPKGDKQAETYRRMRDVTDECWEGSFPKTNVVWLQYLVDVLLLKKSFKRSPKHEREMRSFKKQLNNYNSAKDTISDPFFTELLNHDI